MSNDFPFYINADKPKYISNFPEKSYQYNHNIEINQIEKKMLNKEEMKK